MNNCSKKEALIVLRDLLNKPLLSGRKSPDTELYELSFGGVFSYADWNGKTHPIHTHIIHALCCFTITDRSNKQVKRTFSFSTDNYEFDETIKALAGNKVIKAIINDQNDLCICLENYDITFLASTAEGEAWRYFTTINSGKEPHLVAEKEIMYLV